MNPNFAAYLEGESALLWISRHLEKGGVDRKLLYHLNILSNIIQNGTGKPEIFPLFKRLPQEVFGGLSKGGRRNAQASCLLRGGFVTGGKKPESIGASGYTLEQELLGAWAERDGCWSDYADSTVLKNGAKFLSSGSEARVYQKAGYVYKTIDWNHYGSMTKVLDRISIHNALFPETGMEILGFGMKDDSEDNRGFSVIVRQPFIRGRIPDGPEEVHQGMKQRGLDLPSFTASWFFLTESENVIIYDVHDQNVVIDKSGLVHVFDCEALINTDPKLHGHFVIPEITGSETAVREIDRLLDRLLPVTMDRTLFEEIYSTDENGLSRQLRALGYYDGPVHIGNNIEYLVEVNPENENEVLLSTPDKASLLLSENPEISGCPAPVRKALSAGRAVELNGSLARLSLDKGRIVLTPIKRNISKTTAKAAAEKNTRQPDGPKMRL